MMELGPISYQWARKYLKLYATLLHQEQQHYSLRSVYRVQGEIIDGMVAQMIRGERVTTIIAQIDAQVQALGTRPEGLAASRLAAYAYAREVLSCIPQKERL